MRGLPQKQNARRADKIRLCGHLRRYKKIVKKTYIIYMKLSVQKISGILLSLNMNICYMQYYAGGKIVQMMKMI